MMPPTSIDGTDITGATIDGTDVTEITVDGQTVFTESVEPGTQPPSGVAYWTFDNADTSGSTAVDVWGSNDGTISGGTTTGVSGANQTYTTNEAYRFDGSGDYVQMSPFNLSEGTIAAWINPDSTSGNFVIFSQDAVGINSGDLRFFIDNGNLRLLQQTGSSSGQTIGSSIPVNTWTHVGAAFGSGRELYINGTLDNSNSTSIGMNNTNADANIGSWDNGNDSFDGEIDDVRLYNKQLSSSEFSDLYNNGSIL